MDEFDDFELQVVVHEVTCVSIKEVVAVRFTAGSQMVETDFATVGIVQQSVSILVEQGATSVLVELVSRSLSGGGKVLAVAKLRTTRDLLGGGAQERVFNLTPKSKGTLNPKVKLSILHDVSSADADATNMFGCIDDTAGGSLLRQQLLKVTSAAGAEALSEVDLLVRGCEGPLAMFSSWGRRRQVYAAVVGPPQERRYCLRLWGGRGEYERHARHKQEFELLRIEGVFPDPTRPSVFAVKHLGRDGVATTHNFERVDRARDVWVELLTMLIKAVRDKVRSEKRQQREGRSFANAVA